MCAAGAHRVGTRDQSIARRETPCRTVPPPFRPRIGLPVRRAIRGWDGREPPALDRRRVKDQEETDMSMTTEEIEQRIEDLQASGMHLAAKSLQRELKFRRKDD